MGFLRKTSNRLGKTELALLNIVIVFILSACGQTGELTLPEDPQPQQNESQE